MQKNVISTTAGTVGAAVWISFNIGLGYTELKLWGAYGLLVIAPAEGMVPLWAPTKLG